MCACAICGLRAVMMFGGFNFCGRHSRAAMTERKRAAQITFADLEAAHQAGQKDADGDAMHDKDPIVRRWVLAELTRSRATQGS